ncbi:MAG TPA: DHHA1 domain-containing protein [Thermoanaerobaculia bacterium]|nr:DHHA1 domain-containing protein [Thermoanaerobaculia bacterium]
MPPEELTRSRYAALAELVRDPARAGRWLVLTHDNPDPDAIASAAILGRILSNGFKRKVTLAYGGIVGRAENQELVRVLGAKFSHVRHLSSRAYQRFALVDAQPFTGNSQLPEGVVPDLVFDHHPTRQPVPEVPFTDIRPDFGATATILAEYLQVSGLPYPKSLATAVVYAIRSETQEFGREYSEADKAVYDRLLPEIDRRTLARIQNARLPLSYFRNLHQALENLETVDTLIVSHLGVLEQPDIVPEVADLLLRMEGKTWSLSTGRFADRIYLSIRTTNQRADAGGLIRRLVGRRGKGGGHGMVAGGWIPFDRAPGGDPVAVQKVLARRLARLLRKKVDKLVPIDLEGKG